MKSVEEIARIIDAPIERWPGQCYAIAAALLRHGLVADEDAKLRYGHWLGPVSEECPVEGFRNGAAFQRHGWVEVLEESSGGASIIDPTRWVFEGVEPYIYVGPNDHYDVGGNQWREATLGPCPTYDMRAARSSLSIWRFCADAHRFVMSELFEGAPGVTADMEYWLSNVSPLRLGIHAQPVYQALVDAGARASIPIDNLRLVLGDDA